MKKLQILALSLGITATTGMFATLDNDGFSDIIAKNPRNQEQFQNATKQRIAEEMGNPVTFASFQAFKQKVATFLNSLASSSSPAKNDLKKAVRGIVDLFKAINMISDAKISDSVRSELEDMKSKLSSMNLPSRLQQMLEQRAV